MNKNEKTVQNSRENAFDGESSHRVKRKLLPIITKDILPWYYRKDKVVNALE